MASRVVIGIFDSYAHASDTVEALKTAGFSMDQLSLIGRDTSEMRPVISHLENTPDKMIGNLTVAGAVGGFIVGLAVVAIPGLGALVVAGPIIAAISGAAAGGAIGAVTGALVHFDVPETEAKVYESHITEGKVLLAAHVETPEERFKAEQVMEQCGAVEVDTKAA